jgi:uncharacterized membrane protein YdjX (TVP38/TMEM64 family)
MTDENDPVKDKSDEKKSPVKKIIAALIFVALVIFVAQYSEELSFEAIKESQEELAQKYAAEPLFVITVFMLVYIAVAASSLPLAVPLTLVGGGIFGVVNGTIIVSFASTIGATLAFLVSRLVLGEWVQNKFSNYLIKVNEGVEKEGAFYLFTMRLVPAVPFFAINLAMGLSKIKVWTFYWVSQLGMLAGTIVYVNAGTQLSLIDSPSGILSPGLILSFVALGLFPFIAKWIIASLKSKEK